MMKRKPMKRLPADWGDRLTLSDVDEILNHFRDAECRYLAKLNGDASDGALFADDLTETERRVYDHSVDVVRKRLVMWGEIREMKLRGERVQDILNGALIK